MLLTDARRPVRTGTHGELIALDKQDRQRWHQASITEAIGLLSETLARGAVGPYQVQAAIAAVHAESPTPTDTDWPQIVALYGLLERMLDNPIVALNRAVAVLLPRTRTGARLTS